MHELDVILSMLETHRFIRTSITIDRHHVALGFAAVINHIAQLRTDFGMVSGYFSCGSVKRFKKWKG